jgi:hypothetical protein
MTHVLAHRSAVPYCGSSIHPAILFIQLPDTFGESLCADDKEVQRPMSQEVAGFRFGNDETCVVNVFEQIMKRVVSGSSPCSI